MDTLTLRKEKSRKARKAALARSVRTPSSSSFRALFPSLSSGKALRCFLLQFVAFALLSCASPAPIYRTPDIVEIEVPFPVMAPFDCQCQCQPHKALEIKIEDTPAGDPFLYNPQPEPDWP